MFKYIMLIAVLCAAGCQTTQIGEKADNAPAKLVDRNEKLLLRVDKIVGTYEVVVQRVALTGTDPKQLDQWSIIGSSSISGYPGTFRTSDGSKPVSESGRRGTFLLDGSPVQISQEPGVHLVAKVIPEMQNTARVVGVYAQVTSVGDCFETFSMPFDVSCDLGAVLPLYIKDVPVADQLPMGDIYRLIE